MKEMIWYPGVMARGMRQLKEDLRLVDLVAEILDARVPAASRNLLLSRLAEQKSHLVLLNKADRAEKRVTARWLADFNHHGLRALAYSVYERRYLKALLQEMQQLRHARTGRLVKPLRVMIVGIPNVGKSTITNQLVGRSVARAGNRPGITRGRQWIRLLPGVELLDTPGILWPEMTRQKIFPLAAVGVLPASRVDGQQLAVWLLDKFCRRGKLAQLIKRYPGLERAAPEEMLISIGAGQGCLMAEGKVDLHRAASLVLRDFQAGNLGRMSLEFPPAN